MLGSLQRVCICASFITEYSYLILPFDVGEISSEKSGFYFVISWGAGKRKNSPASAEITRYSNYLREHITIIDPKILILMGSSAMEALFGSKIRISKERGAWKEVIVNQKTYLTMITFHPAYLLRQPDQKKYSWSDLKEIRKKIDELDLKI